MGVFFPLSLKTTLWDTYWMGVVVAIKLLVVAERVFQFYQCGNVCPVAILERYFCSVRWRVWQWKSEAISKSCFQESWGLIQTFFYFIGKIPVLLLGSGSH